ncbi:uncharacterized protein ASCRUDRAFT_10397 [Ascoidea rubescens DSM 1968]|uniref:Uncharacterized protein n=1 Tax=Ascoidea rubescens DSM 1968 TaxID=1344418 RepID=A0A1D2VA79_9ASCO|nr:hypothetical protein ASCRUDRAFT_10397 [Ascoidea rubescens DSM 1968]ODV58367.1 hypothetical protein ASCRUDRAFT_10397 [Ascoidea rubescens DSM 1968]
MNFFQSNKHSIQLKVQEHYQKQLAYEFHMNPNNLNYHTNSPNNEAEYSIEKKYFIDHLVLYDDPISICRNIEKVKRNSVSHKAFKYIESTNDLQNKNFVRYHINSMKNYKPNNDMNDIGFNFNFNE